MANTTNLNMTKLAGTEKQKTFPTTFNGNMDAIDGAFGAGFGVSGKPTVNAEINSLADGLAIISNNNTHAAIMAGQFVYVRGHGSLSDGLYVATYNISANGTLSGSNLTADSSGGLNTVYNALNSNLSFTVDSSANVANDGWATGAEKYGDNDNLIFVKYKNGIVHAYGLFTITTASSSMKVCDIPTGYGASATAQPTQPWGVATRSSGGKSYAVRVPYSSIYFWGDTPETGAYSIDMWWKT